MPIDLSVHPTPDTLRAFASGRIDGEEGERLASHLEQCESCCRLAFDGEVNDQAARRVEAAAACAYSPDSETSTVLRDRTHCQPPLTSPGASSADVEALEVGMVYGNCLLLERIGRGGMGTVYKARHLTMDRIVAVKVISPEFFHRDPALAVTQFEKEVKAVARLSHPRIVAAHDAGLAHGTHFLVMEYVEGCNLHDIVAERGPLSVPMAIDYIRQAAEGMAYAHEQNIIHRDLKPLNLIVDGADRVKVLDLGLARRIEVDSLAKGQNSACLQMGTAGYLSPEQAADPRAADARSDIYSLGCTLWYLLTGQVQSVMAHGEQLPEPIATLRPDAAGLDSVLRRMLAKQPSARYQSMDEVVAALRDVAKSNAARPQPKWMGALTASLATAIVFAVLLNVALYSGIAVDTPVGTIVIDMEDPAGATVTVDGEKVTIDRHGLSDPIEVKADQKKHLLKVTKAGFETYAQEFAVSDQKQKRIHVELKPVGIASSERRVIQRIFADGGHPLVRRNDEDVHLLTQEDVDANRSPLVGFAFPQPKTVQCGNYADAKGVVSVFAPDVDFEKGSLSSLARWPKMRTLNIPRATFEANELRSLANLKDLVELHIDGKHLDDELLGLFAREMVSLETLYIRRSNVSAKALQELANTDIRKLMFFEPSFTGNDLASLPEMKHLGLLWLKDARHIDDDGCLHLSKCERLMELFLDNTKISDVGLRELTKLHSLKSLAINGTRITNDGLASVADMKSLTTLGIAETDVTDEGLKHLAALPNLRTLYLKNSKVTDAGVLTLAEMKNLEVLDLTGSPGITDAIILHIQKLEKLKVCEIQGCGLSTAVEDLVRQIIARRNTPATAGQPTDNEAILRVLADGGEPYVWRENEEVLLATPADVAQNLDPLVKVSFVKPNSVLNFADYTAAKQVRDVYAVGSHLTDNSLAALKQWEKLSKLNLERATFDENDAEHLEELDALQELAIAFTGLKDEQVARVIAKLKSLKGLGIDGSQLGPAAVKQLATSKIELLKVPHSTHLSSQLEGLAAMPELQHLLLNHSRHVGDEHCEWIGRCGNLRLLDLEGTAVGNDGLARLKKLNHVRHLVLTGTNTTNGGLQHLGEMKSLAAVYLGNTKIVGDEGFDHIAALPALLALYISNCDLSDAGVATLAGSPSLVELGFGTNPRVTDDALPHLEKMQTLINCDASHTSLSEAGAARLRELLNRNGNPAQRARQAENKLMLRILAAGGAPYVQRNGVETALTTQEEILANADPLNGIVFPNDGPKQVRLEEFADAKNVHYVHAPGAILSANSMRTLGGWSMLRDLNLANAKFDPQDIQHLATLKNLFEIRLNGTQVGDAEVAVLAGLPTIDMIDVGNSKITSAALPHLAGSASLTRLGLSHSNLSGDDLAPLAKMPKLREINLSFCPKINDAACAQLARCKKLIDINVDVTSIGDGGLAHLKALKNLGTLYLNQTAITSDGLVAIGEMKLLRSLGIAGVPVEKEGLVRLQGLPHLTYLLAADCQLDNDCVAAIAELKNLEDLFLNDNKAITDDALPHLDKLTKLRWCEMFRCGLSEAGETRFQGRFTR